MKALLITLIAVAMQSIALAQLDSKHFIPPIYYGLAEGGSGAHNFDRHYLVLSTPSVADVNVVVKDGADNILLNTTLSNNAPIVHLLGKLDNAGVYQSSDAVGSGNIVGNSKLNTPVTDGLIIEASAPVYANIRHQSGYQGASLTSKGRPALGNEFRVATMRNNDVLDHNYRSLFFSLMAVEDGTVVEVDEIKDGIVFMNSVASGSPKTTEAVTITLNKGESYVMGIKNDKFSNQGGTASLNEVNGTRVRSSKPIVMNSGTVLGCPVSGNYGSRDMGFDQIAPVTRAGTEYLLVKGAGSNGSDLETVTVVATSDNTNIFVRDALSPVNSSALMAGDYLFLTGEYDANGNLFIRSDQPVLVWQTIGGANSAATPGLNFVPPLNQDIAKSVDNIAEINLIGEASLKIVGRAGHPVTINGEMPETGPISVTGTDEWVVYTQTKLTGNPKVESTSAIATSLTMLKNPIGAAAYYSGYPEIKPLIISNSPCPTSLGAQLEAIDPAGNIYTSYEWFHENGASTGVTGKTFTPMVAGSYYTLATSGSNIAGDAVSALYTVETPTQADLQVSLGIDKNQAEIGDLVNVTVTVTNHSGDPVSDVKVNCVLPDGLTYQRDSITGGVRNADSSPSEFGLVWELAELTSNSGVNTTTLGFSAILNESGAITTQVDLNTCAQDTLMENNVAAITIDVQDPNVEEDPCCNKEAVVEFNIRDLDLLATHGVLLENYNAARDVWHKVRKELNCDAEGITLEDHKRGFQEEDFYIAEDSEVIVTVIYDGANHYNTVAFYDANDPENTWKTIWESFVTGPSAPLIPGSASSLGVVPAGTNLRFGLVKNGAIGGTEKVYQDAELNPNNAVRVASNLFLGEEDRPLVVAFEDLFDPRSDNDFNDVIFKVEVIPTGLGVAQNDNVVLGQAGLKSDRGSRGLKTLLQRNNMSGADYEFTAEVFEVPADLTELTLDLIDDRGPMKFTFGVVDYALVSSLSPDSLDFRRNAVANGTILMDDRQLNPGAVVTINPQELGLAGKEVMFYIIPNNVPSQFLKNPWRYTAKGNGNKTKRQPLFSVNNANPQSKDQFFVFSDGDTTLLSIENYSRTEDTVEAGLLSDSSFDDIQIRLTPALTPLSFHDGGYLQGSVDPTAGFTGTDGYNGSQQGSY